MRSGSRWRQLAELRRHRHQEPGVAAVAPPTLRPPPPTKAPPPPRNAAPQPLPPTDDALRLLPLLHSHPLEAALAHSSFSPTPHNLASLIDLLADPSRSLRAFLWSVRQPSFSSHPLVTHRISPLLPNHQSPTLHRSLLSLHLFWHQRDFVLSPDLLNDFISIYCQFGSVDDALEVLNAAPSKGAEPQVEHFNQVLQAAVKNNKLETAQWLFGRMPNIHRPPNVVTFNILINGCCEAGKIQEAFDLFREMSLSGLAPNELTYTYVISGITKAGEVDTGLQLLREMQHNGHRPTEYTYGVLMKGFCYKGDLQTTSTLLNEMRAEGLSLEDSTYDALVIAICEAKGIHEMEARRLLDGMAANFGAWNTGT